VIEASERIRPYHSHEQKESFLGLNGLRYVVDKSLDVEQITQDLKRIKETTDVTSVAVVLMHSYAMPESENRIGEIAKSLGFKQVSLSHQIMQRVKLVKRGQTCCVDAYLNPHILRYLDTFVRGFDEGIERVKVFFM
jgi:5-oxoprolinase (ATP-hydrolysing)